MTPLSVRPALFSARQRPGRSHETPPTETPITRTAYAFEVPAPGRMRRTGLIDEPRGSVLEAKLDIGAMGWPWLDLYAAGRVSRSPTASPATDGAPAILDVNGA